jgi:Family of unknown function (DUF6384)
MAQEAIAGPEKQPAPPKLDDLMMAMDVVDTLRHRDRLVERELNEEAREEQLISRLRSLYKSQGLDVPDSVIAQGVKALKESRFVYTAPKPGFERWLAYVWVKRFKIGQWAGVSLAILALALGTYYAGVVRPERLKREAARVELTKTLPQNLEAAHQAILAEAQVPEARQRADSLLADGRSALSRGNAASARAALAGLDDLSNTLRQEYTLRIAGRPEDQTGFYRENPRFHGRAYFVVVNAAGPNGNPVKVSVRNDETNQTEAVSRFAVRVPQQTFEAVQQDKSRNGIVQNVKLAEKRRGYLEPSYLMPVLPGRITRW